MPQAIILLLESLEGRVQVSGLKPRCAIALTGVNGKCLIENSVSGYVKLVSDSATNRLLGAQLICPRATNLIGELALAVQQKLTVSQLAAAVHAHPTFSEMIYAAAQQIR